MNRTRSGSTVIAVVGILAVIVVIGIIWYFVSDPFRTKVDAAADQMTKWTPENIAKDPVNYLNFCETKTKQAMLDLKADRISIEQNRAKLQDMKESAGAKVRVGEKILVDLKGTWEKDVWPVSLEGQSREKDWVKTQVVSLFKQVETQRSILGKVEGGLKKLDAQVIKIDKAQGDAQAQLAEIAANRELLKVQKLTDELKDRLVSMKGALQGVVNTASERGGVISLDQIVAESAPVVDTSEFDKVLGKIK